MLNLHLPPTCMCSVYLDVLIFLKLIYHYAGYLVDNFINKNQIVSYIKKTWQKFKKYFGQVSKICLSLKLLLSKVLFNKYFERKIVVCIG